MRRGLMMLQCDGGVVNPVFVDNLCDAIFAGMRTDTRASVQHH